MYVLQYQPFWNNYYRYKHEKNFLKVFYQSFKYFNTVHIGSFIDFLKPFPKCGSWKIARSHRQFHNSTSKCYRFTMFILSMNVFVCIFCKAARHKMASGAHQKLAYSHLKAPGHHTSHISVFWILPACANIKHSAIIDHYWSDNCRWCFDIVEDEAPR